MYVGVCQGWRPAVVSKHLMRHDSSGGGGRSLSPQHTHNIHKHMHTWKKSKPAAEASRDSSTTSSSRRALGRRCRCRIIMNGADAGGGGARGCIGYGWGVMIAYVCVCRSRFGDCLACLDEWIDRLIEWSILNERHIDLGLESSIHVSCHPMPESTTRSRLDRSIRSSSS